MASLNITPAPVLDTWTDGQFISVDWLNRNVRDAQNFVANAPVTLVTRAATQSIPNATSNSHVTWDTEVIDTDDMVTVPSTDIVAQRPGLYAVQLQIPFAFNASGQQRSASINLNGANVGQQVDNTTTTSAPCMMVCSAIVYMNTGDILVGNAFQDSGAALNIGTFNGPRMLVRLVSAAQLDVNLALSGGTGAPISTPPTGGTPSVHEQSFYATWSRSYGPSGATTWDDSAYCYQGYYSSARGNTRSLVGFNYNDIQSTLKGATNVKVWLTYKVAHSYYNAGLTAIIGQHKYGSKPSSWTAGNCAPDQVRRQSSAPGGTYTVRLPDYDAWSFQNGVMKGIMFGPGPNTGLGYYGYMYGATQGGRPYLTFQYTS